MSLKYYFFKWNWCTACHYWYIECPVCGNNCCNGTFGPLNGNEYDHTCIDCERAYQYQHDHYDEHAKGLKASFILMKININRYLYQIRYFLKNGEFDTLFYRI